MDIFSIFLNHLTHSQNNARRLAQLAIITTLVLSLTSCGEGDGESSSNSSPPVVDGGVAACNVPVSSSIASESDRYETQLENIAQDSQELIVRTNQLGQVYDLGDFLLNADTLRRINTNGAELPTVNLPNITFTSSYTDTQNNSDVNEAFATFSGFSLGAKVSEAEGRRLSFESELTIQNLRFRQLNNTQELIDVNQSLAPNANGFVYGIYEGEYLTKVKVAAGCDNLTDKEIQAAIDFFDASQQVSARKSSSVSGSFEIVSNGRIPIAYNIRQIDPAITEPENLSAGVGRDRRITLQWDPVQSVQNYRVFYSQNPGFNRDSNNVVERSVTTNRFELIQGVDLGETWHFRVASVTGGIVGRLSNPLAVGIPLAAPEFPLFLSARPQANGAIKLSWDAPVNNDANNFILFKRTKDETNWVQIASINQSNDAQRESFRLREYVDNDVTPGTEYEYQITYENLLSPPNAPLSEIIRAIAAAPSQNSQAPVAVISSVPTVNELQVVTLNGSDSFDPDNDPLSYLWTASSSNPIAVSIQNPTSSVANFVAPQIEEPFIVLTFELTVSDGPQGLRDRKTVDVTVFDTALIDPTNNLPNVNLTATETEVLEGDIITLDASQSSDPDGDDLTFVWRQVNNLNIDTGIDGMEGSQISINAPFNIEDETTFLFLVTVSDGKGVQTGTIEVVVKKRGAAGVGLILGTESLSGTLEPGETDYWMLTVTNTSEFPREDVNLEAFFPSNFLADIRNSNLGFGGSCGSPGSTNFCDSPNETMRWSLGDLAAGQSKKVGFAPTILSSINQESDIEFNARVTDGFSSSNSDSLLVKVIPERHLELSMVADNQYVRAGETVTFTLVYGFSQASNLAENTQLTFNFPSNLTFRGMTVDGALSNTTDGRKITWDVGTLLRGETGTLSVSLLVASDLIAGELTQVNAQLVDDNAQTTPTQVSRQLIVVNNHPLDISVDTTHAPAKRALPVENFITITNPTTEVLTDIEFQVRLEADAYAAFSNRLISDSGACISSACEPGEWITWAIDKLAVGESRKFRFSPTISNTAEQGSAINLINAYSIAGNTYIHNAQTVPIALNNNLEVAISADQNPVLPGETMRYDVAYLFNQPSAQLEDVTLKVILPKNTLFIGASHGGIYDGSSVSWSLGTLKPGQANGQRTVDVMVNAASSPGMILKANAMLASSEKNYVFESISLPVASSRPLDVKLSGNNSPQSAGQRETIYVTVENTSDFPRDDVTVELGYQAEWGGFRTSDIGDNVNCSSGSTCVRHGEKVEWKIDQLDRNSSRTFNLMPAIASGNTDNVIQLNAKVKDASTARARAESHVILQDNRHLQLKLSGAASPVTPGESFTLFLHYGVTASGDSISQSRLTLNLPENVSLLSASNGGIASGNTVTWTPGMTASGTTNQVSALLRVNNDSQLLGSALSFDATLEHSDSSNNMPFIADKFVLSVSESRNLDVKLSAVNQTPMVGESPEIKIEVKNNASFSLANQVIRVRFPAGFNTLSSSNIVGGSCPGTCTAGEYITWELDTLAEGETRELMFSPVVSNDVEVGQIIPIGVISGQNRDSLNLRVSQ